MTAHFNFRNHFVSRSTPAVIVWIGISLVFPALAPDAIAAGTPSYPMVCRGGGGITVNITHQMRRLTIRFRSARVGAATRQPGPGECAWLDRPLRSNEPRLLTYWANKNQLNITISSDRRLLGLSVDGDQRSRHWRELFQAVMNGRVFYVRAYNERNPAWLIITRVGP
jgi:hypothetical protein